MVQRAFFYGKKGGIRMESDYSDYLYSPQDKSKMKRIEGENTNDDNQIHEWRNSTPGDA